MEPDAKSPQAALQQITAAKTAAAKAKPSTLAPSLPQPSAWLRRSNPAQKHLRRCSEPSPALQNSPPASKILGSLWKSAPLGWGSPDWESTTSFLSKLGALGSDGAAPSLDWPTGLHQLGRKHRTATINPSAWPRDPPAELLSPLSCPLHLCSQGHPAGPWQSSET